MISRTKTHFKYDVETEKAGDRIQGNIFGCFVIHFHLLHIVQLKHKSFYMTNFARGMAVDIIYMSVHKSNYLDITKTQMEIKTSFSFLFGTLSSNMEDCFWNFPSHLAKWLSPVSYLYFLNVVMVFNQMYILFSWSYWSVLFCHQSWSSLNVWKTVVKFLGIIVVLLTIQSWKDAAASQLR